MSDALLPKCDGGDPCLNSGGGLSQEVLRAHAPVYASLQVLQELGDQLKQQVDTSAASAIQSDHLSLTQRLAAGEQNLTRQLITLQVRGQPGHVTFHSNKESDASRCLCSPHQTGVHDYETFNDQLDSLGCWVVEAELALKVQDPSSSTDLTVIRDRMAELKVRLWDLIDFHHTDTEKYNSRVNVCTFMKDSVQV